MVSRGFTGQPDGTILLKANKNYLLRSQFIITKSTNALRTEIGLYNMDTGEYFENSNFSVDGILQVYEYPLRLAQDTNVQIRFSTLNSTATVKAGVSFIEVKEL